MHVPEIIEGARCVYCRNPALPFDAGDGWAFCAEHAIEAVTGWGPSDLESSGEVELSYEHHQAVREVWQHGACIYGSCGEPGEPRLVLSMIEFVITEELCLEHSVDTYLEAFFVEHLHPFSLDCLHGNV